MIASPPTIEYNNDFNQPNSNNFLQTNEVLNQQNDINQQGIDSNQIKFIVDPFNSPQYCPDGNPFEINDKIKKSIPKTDLSKQEYNDVLIKAQNIANSDDKLENVLKNEEQAYTNYFRHLNSMEYNRVINTNLDKNSLKMAYSEMYSPESNKMVLNQLNHNRYDFSNIIRNSNNTLFGDNNIDLSKDRKKIQKELSGFYNYLNNNPPEIDMKTNKLNIVKNYSNQNIIKPSLKPKSNSTKIIHLTERKYPRFRSNDPMRVSMENLFTGIDKENQGKKIVN